MRSWRQSLARRLQSSKRSGCIFPATVVHVSLYGYVMNKPLVILLLLVFFAVVSGCNENTVDDSPPPLTCLGFRSPNLNIKVMDSISGSEITDANVTMIVSNSSGTQSTVVAWDDTLSGYYAPTEALVNGTYSVVAARDAYNASVVKNIEFVADTSCGAANDWALTLYMCPVGTACI